MSDTFDLGTIIESAQYGFVETAQKALDTGQTKARLKLRASSIGQLVPSTSFGGFGLADLNPVSIVNYGRGFQGFDVEIISRNPIIWRGSNISILGPHASQNPFGDIYFTIFNQINPDTSPLGQVELITQIATTESVTISGMAIFPTGENIVETGISQNIDPDWGFLIEFSMIQRGSQGSTITWCPNQMGCAISKHAILGGGMLAPADSSDVQYIHLLKGVTNKAFVDQDIPPIAALHETSTGPAEYVFFGMMYPGEGPNSLIVEPTDWVIPFLNGPVSLSVTNPATPDYIAYNATAGAQANLIWFFGDLGRIPIAGMGGANFNPADLNLLVVN